MKPIGLDMARANRPGVAPGMIALLLAVGLLLVAMRYLDHLKQNGEALDERETSIARQEQKYQVIGKAHRNPGNPHAEELMAQQRYAAEPARDLIERGWSPNLALLSLEVVTTSRQINMTFETRTAQEALSYADWIEAQPATERVSVMRQTLKPGPPVKSVETTLQITWRANAGEAAASAASAPSTAAAGAPAEVHR
jgi:type II secretory pathway component PulJ